MSGAAYKDFYIANERNNAMWKLPVVVLGTNRHPRYVLASQCHVVAGQPVRGKLNDGDTGDMVGFAVQRPRLNMQWIKTHGRQVLGLDHNPILVSHDSSSRPRYPMDANDENQDANTGFGINIEPNLVPVNGRLLDIAPITFHGDKVPVKDSLRLS